MAEKIMTVSDFIEFEKRLFGRIDNLIIMVTGNEIRRKYLKSKDVRKLLGNISAGKLQEMRVKKQISFIKIGGMLLYDYDEIVKILENNKIK
ncbi:MAG: helix-turn-helix domain-containing protein [Bacteroidetes bacterium]|nr:helix-turn-helix domain-containing protein [Bacteroidota bacterium]